jgi:hypothetical protein
MDRVRVDARNALECREMNMHQPPKPVRRFWESEFGQRLVRILEPSKWWVAIFVVGLIAVNVWMLTIYRSQSRDEATHAAELVANANGQHTACVKSIPVLTKINAFIAGDLIIRNTLVENAEANLRANPDSPTKIANYDRLIRARAKAYEVKFPVPTVKSCAALRTQLLKSK